MKKYSVILTILLLAIFLRLYRLESVPVSLFGDEMDVGYQAYSVLKTGRDYYGNFLPLHFHSIAEWRTPLYLYSAVPTVALYGISPLGVRLPAAIFGVLGVAAFYFLVKIIREEHLKIGKAKFFGIEEIGALFLAISPWHIQYSRAGFEVTQLLFFLFAGLYFFFRGLKESRFLYIAAFCFGLMPWIYSTAKLFTPALVAALVTLYFHKLVKLSKKNIAGSFLVLMVFLVPLAYNIVFGGGAQRFGYINVFSDPTVEHEVGVARDIDSWGNGFASRVFHNKFVIWGEAVINNFLRSFSTGFFFVEGDLNLRHSIEDMGMFYRVEFFAMLLGIVGFFSLKADKKVKLFLLFWIFGGAFPSAITRDGGSHATRLILVLAPLLFLISYGVSMLSRRRAVGLVYCALVLVLFVQYQHLYWIHNPTYSERWWHYGWKQAINEIKKIEDDYSKVIISTNDEPPWVFFAASYEYPPERWQKGFPLTREAELDGFGKVSFIDKYYFGSPQNLELYDWGKIIKSDTLYLASTKEVRVNLIREPQRTPGDLVLLDTVAFPSGEPAFYIFTGRDNNEN